MKKRKLFTIIVVILVISMMGLSAQCGFGGESPTLELEIYDGPDYSESDGMCYYRVEAISTGTPAPQVEFAQDDNVEAIGTGRVEVGVEVGDTYTLTATATNSAGTATVSIVLDGNCGDETEVTETDEDADGNKEKVGAPGREKPPKKRRATGQQKTDYDPLRRLVLNGRLHIGRIKAAKARIQDLALEVAGKDGVFNLDPLHLNLYKHYLPMLLSNNYLS